MKKVKIVLGTVLLLLLLIVTISSANYNISGYVKGTDDLGVVSTLDNVNVYTTNKTDDTNSSGYYLLTNFTNGSYEVNVFRGDFYPNTTTVIVNGTANETNNNFSLVCYKLTKATTGLDNLDEEPYDELQTAIDDYDFTAFVVALSLPYVNIMGNIFFLLLFGMPFMMAWIRQQAVIIPVIWGIILGSTIELFLPQEYGLIAKLILVLSILGIFYLVFKERF